jgi:iron complex outermembrane receptor protein
MNSKVCASPAQPPRKAPTLAVLIGVTLLGAASWTGAQTGDLFEMSIEELGQISVVSMARRAEELTESAAAVYVITAEEIRRSGARTIPDALRLAPGVEVARNGTSSWTISMRGFNSDLSNKLLVLIDGRSVYSPLYAGVFWDAQDTLLADIDRIEVIAGPGGTIWGTNAVNGVINIITRSAADTHGFYAETGGGRGEEGFAALRYGGAIGESVDARVYVKHFERDNSSLSDGADVRDEWRGSQAGFNLRWEATDNDTVTLRGDVYDSEQDVLTRGDFTIGTLPDEDVPGAVDVEGHNIVGRWRRTLAGGGGTRLQVYFDHTDRRIPGSFDEKRDTYDVDYQHDLTAYGRHRLTWGTGLRVTSDELDNTLFASFLPPERTDRTWTAFVQDRIAFRGEAVLLTVGSKFESNDYTGFEHQPSARVAWTVDTRQSIWGAVSRAVRTPARLNSDLRLFAPITDLPPPFYVNVNGDPAFESEELLAIEGGYRLLVTDALSFDVAVFDNEYDELQTTEFISQTVETDPVPHTLLTARIGNGMQGETYGGTAALTWQSTERWRLRFHYSRLEMDLRLKPGSSDTGALDIAGNSPKHQLAFHGVGELRNGLGIYAGARYVDALPNLGIPRHLTVDVSLGWSPTEKLSTSLTVRSLNDTRHVEYGPLAIDRSVFLSLAWRL